MGGMIAQTLAIRHAKRVRTLTFIMSTTGDPGLPPPQPAALSVLLAPPPPDRAAAIEASVRSGRAHRGPRFPFDEAHARQRAAQAYDRSHYPAGKARQMAAVVASGSLKDALKSVTVPTLVIHGGADPLVPVEAGRATARAIPGAKLLIIEGMGHELPAAAWPQIIEAIAQHAV